jgi:cystathionine beta-lyase/cystathionine gamma-synthase
MDHAATRLLHALDAAHDGDPASPDLTLSSYLVSTDEGRPEDYLRADQPNWRMVERVLGTLEDAGAVVFSSGQAASHALLADLVGTGHRIVMPDDGYYNSRALAALVTGPTVVDWVAVDQRDPAAVAAQLDDRRAALWVETPSNPWLRVADLAALGGLAAAHGAPVVCDNTLATALLQQPCDLGARASVYSLTKALAGHSDLLMGAVVSRDPGLIERLRSWRTLTGGIPGAFSAWLAVRSLKTLAVRLPRQCASALAIAQHLLRHPAVTAVHYPGLGARRVIADRQMHGGYGPVLSFELDGDAAVADAVVRASRLLAPGTSFGGVVSSWERRGRWADETVPATLIRLSAGIEHVDDLLDDVDRALRAGVPGR